MSKRFEPVRDQERARCEQNEEDLRKHRQFDTPFALLPKNLNDPKQPKGDLNPVGKKSDDLYQDEKGLWRKKSDLFDKQKSWGRETFQYSNPEEARDEGSNVNRKKRPGDVEWGTRGSFGGRIADNGTLVMQRGEVAQIMVKNDKGLWMQKKLDKEVDEKDSKDSSPLPEGCWRCKKCLKSNKQNTDFCIKCDTDKTLYEQYKPKPGEDPRLEAAKPKGRGTADAQAKALQALEARRKKEKDVKDQLGMSRRPDLDRSENRRHETYIPLNSSSQQVRASKRSRKHQNWQGVQLTDEDAARVVAKATGGSSIGKDSQEAAKPVRIEDLKADRQANRDRSPSACSFRPSSSSGSREGSQEPTKDFAWQSPERSRSPKPPAKTRSPSPRSKRLGRCASPSPRSKRLGRCTKAASPSPRSKRLGRCAQPPQPSESDGGGGASGDVVVDFF